MSIGNSMRKFKKSPRLSPLPKIEHSEIPTEKLDFTENIVKTNLNMSELD